MVKVNTSFGDSTAMVSRGMGWNSIATYLSNKGTLPDAEPQYRGSNRLHTHTCQDFPTSLSLLRQTNDPSTEGDPKDAVRYWLFGQVSFV